MDLDCDVVYVIGAYIASPEEPTDRFILVSSDTKCNPKLDKELKRAFKASKIDPEIKEGNGVTHYVFSRRSSFARMVYGIMPIIKSVPIELLTTRKLQIKLMSGFLDRCQQVGADRLFSTRHIEIVYDIKKLCLSLGYKIEVSCVTFGSYCVYDIHINLER